MFKYDKTNGYEVLLQTNLKWMDWNSIGLEILQKNIVVFLTVNNFS